MNKIISFIDDQVQSILFIDDLVEPLSKIINEELTGVFHIASSDTTTPYESGSYLLGNTQGSRRVTKKFNGRIFKISR